MDLELKDKVVMITGSTGGLGTALTKAFAAEGCRLSISSTSREKLDKLLGGLDISPERVMTSVVDVTREEQVAAMVENTVARFGALDVQVNNAGYEGRFAPVAEQTYEDFMRVYNINVFGPMYGMKYASRQMLKQGSGAIVVIASDGSYVGAAGMAPYVSSKHAVAGIAKCVALELADKGIRVNCVCPGAIDTPMMRSIEKAWLGEDVPLEEAKKTFSASYPDGRYAKPSEVADLAVYLASARSGHITGSCIRQDGGMDATC